MEIGQCRVIIARSGDDVAKFKVTPAEVQVLREAFKDVAGKDPVTDLVLIGTVERHPQAERARLVQRYGNLRVKHENQDRQVVGLLFPGSFPVLPGTFEQLGVSAPPRVTDLSKVGPQNYNPTPEGNIEDPELAEIERIEESLRQGNTLQPEEKGVLTFKENQTDTALQPEGPRKSQKKLPPKPDKAEKAPVSFFTTPENLEATAAAAAASDEIPGVE